jgi:hypothetical protein
MLQAVRSPRQQQQRRRRQLQPQPSLAEQLASPCSALRCRFVASRCAALVDDGIRIISWLVLLLLLQENPPAVLQIDDPHLCLFVDDAVRAKYPDAEASGEKTALFAPFIYKMHYFTKTGSGQT